MFRQLKKNLVATLIAAMTIGQVAPAFADSADTLPDMGTSAGSTLSIGQEMQMGDYYVRQLRGSAPLINDPLLTQYINSLGMRLVSHANSVKTPFHFFQINNDEINAFAFFGGNVVLHSALFRYSDNESQLASVMAHEISHVTQRHLARAREDQQRSAPLTWVGAVGSILLAMASPQAGMAALTGTLAGTRQGMISFTQQNEQEADRIGIQVLQRSGFDPQAMMDCGMGLSNINSRVSSLNGTFDIRSSKGRGMCASVKVNVRGAERLAPRPAAIETPRPVRAQRRER